MILTAASEAYGPSLLALLGSLDCNWPGHPPVRVYDIGLAAPTLAALARHGIEAHKVPPFCPHWRKHFAWKIWCWNDAPAKHILWLDAGLAVLRPVEEAFVSIDKLGYFVAPTYHLLERTASEAACAGCGVEPDFRRGRMTMCGNVMGFDKRGPVGRVLVEALELAHHEECLAASEPLHRHDQALISLLLHRDFSPLVACDGLVFGGWESPRQTPAQAIWAHRRRMMPDDVAFFANAIGHGRPHQPALPGKPQPRSIKEAYWSLLRRVKRLAQPARQPWIYDGVRTSPQGTA